jgi:hypothetical protein
VAAAASVAASSEADLIRHMGGSRIRDDLNAKIPIVTATE